MPIVPTRKPFSFPLALAFMRRFPAFASEAIVEQDRVTAAIAIGTRAHAFALQEKHGELELEIAADAPDELAKRVADVVSADDDLAPFYAAAEGDAPFLKKVRKLHGLHHVRFLGGLPEIAVYCVMMQRNPPVRAARMKSRFLDRFGLTVRSGEHTLRAMPELPALARLEVADIAEAIGNREKAARIGEVVRGVAALGEPFLCDAPYADAKAALLAIDGVGPFSAGAILLRGLGRMDELPSMEMFEREGRAIYGRAWDPDAVVRRYGAQIGYWSFYAKTTA
jgi:DNA-3-methyladenine glycosylase II